MPALYFTMTKHSLHISMLFRTQLVLRRKQATMRPIEMMDCITLSMLSMTNTSVGVKGELQWKQIWRVLSVRDGPLEKWWEGTREFFFKSIAFARFFCRGQVHCTIIIIIFFFLGGGGGEGVKLSTVAVLILTLCKIWMPGKGFKEIFLMFQTVFLLYCQNNIPAERKSSIRHIQVENNSNILLLPKMVLHLIFIWCLGNINFIAWSGSLLSTPSNYLFFGNKSTKFSH